MMYKLTKEQIELIGEWLRDSSFMGTLSYEVKSTITIWYYTDSCTTGADYSELRNTLRDVRELWCWHLNSLSKITMN